jgi:metal-responsive CopG/Arc/MetJ family transcriptional regulator
MKTAVSIPDDVFQGAERFARQTKRSRSRLFNDALREYLLRHAPEELTESMNQACMDAAGAEARPFSRKHERLGLAGNDEFASAASTLILERSEW